MKKLSDLIIKDKKRFVAPFVGLSGLSLISQSQESAQRNSAIHFKAISELYHKLKPDIIFPIMNIYLEANAFQRKFGLLQNNLTINSSPTFDFSLFEIEAIFNDVRIKNYLETIEFMTIKLPKNVIKGAFITGPFTLSSLIYGMENTKKAIKGNFAELERIIGISYKISKRFIELLKNIGVELICVLEPMTSLLSPKEAEKFSFDYLRNLTDIFQNEKIHSVLHICGNTMPIVSKMSNLGFEAISLDSPVVGINLVKVFKIINENVIVMGNINPTGKLFSANPQEVEDEVSELLIKMKKHPNFILSTGCDVPLETPLENLKAFMKAGRIY